MANIETSIIQSANSTDYEAAVSSLSRSSALNVHNYARQVLAEHLKKHGVIISTVYKETLRSIRNIFGNCYFFDGDDKLTKVPCIAGNPERTIGKLFQESNLQLPIISVIQTSSDDADERRRYVAQIVVETIWNDEIRRGQRILSIVPRPVNITYEVIIWTKFNEDMDHIATQIRSSFNPSLDIITPQSDLTKGFIAEEDNISTFDTGDREDRVIRKIFRISVETYIPSPKFLITNTGKIETFNAEVDLYKSASIEPK